MLLAAFPLIVRLSLIPSLLCRKGLVKLRRLEMCDESLSRSDVNGGLSFITSLRDRTRRTSLILGVIDFALQAQR